MASQPVDVANDQICLGAQMQQIDLFTQLYLQPAKILLSWLKQATDKAYFRTGKMK